MKSYDGLNYSYGTHRVRVTLQDGEFKGSFSFEVGGNCKGYNVLEFDIIGCDSDDIKHFNKSKGMKMHRYEEEDDYIYLVLTTDVDNVTGEFKTCEYELRDEEFMKMITKIEIVSFSERTK